MKALTNFVRGLLGVIVVILMILVVVGLGWGVGMWLSGALGVDPAVPVIFCMVVPLVVLGLWMESTHRLDWVRSRD
jgi:sterol desaturase/sphingolipid hydroxylase (fatty acid hydroxylase superfamily)